MKGKSKARSVAAIRLAAIFLFASLVSGCSFGSMPTAAPQVDTAPTFQAVQTEAAKTVVAELTQIAPTPTLVLPSTTNTEPAPATETAQPTMTNTSAPATVAVPPTATFTSAAPTATLRPVSTATPVNTACRIEDQSPVFGADLNRNADFDGVWKVKNTSKTIWSSSAVDIKYLSGTKFQTKVDILDLPSDVAVDGTYTVVLDMRAPDQTGRFSTTWAITQGSTALCTMSLTIDVIE